MNQFSAFEYVGRKPSPWPTSENTVTINDAGELGKARPAVDGVVFWSANTGVDIGNDAAAVIVNAQDGDYVLYGTQVRLIQR